MDEGRDRSTKIEHRVGFDCCLPQIVRCRTLNDAVVPKFTVHIKTLDIRPFRPSYSAKLSGLDVIGPSAGVVESTHETADANKAERDALSESLQQIQSGDSVDGEDLIRSLRSRGPGAIAYTSWT